MPARKKSPAKDSTANLGFEAKLWLAAEMLVQSEKFVEFHTGSLLKFAV